MSNLNWLAILVAAIAYFFLGAIWYSFLFQKQWIALSKIDMADPNMKKGVPAIMFGSFMMMLLTSFGLAVLCQFMDLHHWQEGLHLGLVTGIFFACTSMAINMLYEKKPIGLFFINGGYQLLGNVIAAVIITSFR